ncbi:MAG: hypothetical protein ACXVJW_12520 [Acidimicrobiia bacterium]
MSLGLVLVCTLAPAACSSGGKSSSTKAKASTPPTTAAPAKHGMTVDLVVTGDRPITIQGTKGTCYLRNNGQPSSFVVLASDYPALGPGGSIIAWGPTRLPRQVTVPPNVRVYINGGGMVSPNTGAGVKVGPDDTIVTLSADLGGGLGGSRVDSLSDPTNTLHGHIIGTMRCD